MFLDLEAGQDRIIFLALKVPEHERFHWFNKLRSFMRANVQRIPDVTPSDLLNILEVIDQTEAALK